MENFNQELALRMVPNNEFSRPCPNTSTFLAPSWNASSATILLRYASALAALGSQGTSPNLLLIAQAINDEGPQHAVVWLHYGCAGLGVVVLLETEDATAVALAQHSGERVAQRNELSSMLTSWLPDFPAYAEAYAGAAIKQIGTITGFSGSAIRSVSTLV